MLGVRAASAALTTFSPALLGNSLAFSLNTTVANAMRSSAEMALPAWLAA